MEVRACSLGGGDFRDVLALHRSAKATVGFLPDEAIRERVLRGTLLVIEDESKMIGYVLYDLPRDVVTIRQLVVDRSARQAGVARLLVDALIELYGDSRRGIGLTCRRDFDASRVWPRLNFVPLAERPGRGRASSLLTWWWLSFQRPDLFTLANDQDQRPVAVLDTNIVIRGADGDGLVVDAMLADWAHAEARFGVADETYVEIDRHGVQSVRVAHKRYAMGFDEVRGPSTLVSYLESQVINELGANMPAHIGGTCWPPRLLLAVPAGL